MRAAWAAGAARQACRLMSLPNECRDRKQEFHAARTERGGRSRSRTADALMGRDGTCRGCMATGRYWRHSRMPTEVPAGLYAVARFPRRDYAQLRGRVIGPRAREPVGVSCPNYKRSRVAIDARRVRAVATTHDVK